MLRCYWSCFEFYAVRPGSRSLQWDCHNPVIHFEPPSDSDRPMDTAGIEQDHLKAYQEMADGVFSGECSTFVIWDESSDFHFDPTDEAHVENPKRTVRILDRMRSSGLLDRCECVSNSRLASESELEGAHERPYIKQLARIKNMSDDELRKEEQIYDSIFLRRDSFDVARRAVGATLEAVDKVVGSSCGQYNAFAVVRPPGHHAGFDKPSGFCLLNNVAVACSYALSKYSLERILILDWDIHHGNGTQDIFYEDDRVLYISLHRHDGGSFFPLGEPKDHLDVGKGKGIGRNVNIPWSYGYMGDLEYRTAFSKIVLPIASEFSPQLVLISAGFDAAVGDPLGEYKVSPSTYALMTHQLAGLAGGRTIAILEGGYNLDSISESAAAVLETLLENRVKQRITEEREHYGTKKSKVHPEAWVTMRRVAQTQQNYWSSLRGFQVAVETEEHAPHVLER